MRLTVVFFFLSLQIFAGSIKPLIVGGEKITDRSTPEYKHTARLYVSGVLGATSEFGDYDGIEISWRCSASLIRTNVIITAAHCLPEFATLNRPNNEGPVTLPVDVSDVTVYFGPESGDEPAWGVKVTEYIRHEGFDDKWINNFTELWNPRERVNDVAVGLLNFHAPSEKRPVQVLSPEEQLTRDSELVLAGYGKSYEELKPTLRKVAVPFRTYLDNDSDFFAGEGDVTDPGAVENPQGACGGDSGGPAYLPTPSGYKLAGIIARGPDESNGGCKASMTILTSTASYYDWINDTADELAKEN